MPKYVVIVSRSTDPTELWRRAAGDTQDEAEEELHAVQMNLNNHRFYARIERVDDADDDEGEKGA